jgi:hypothetical protein
MDENIKQPALVGIIVFNMAFMLYQFFRNWGDDFSWTQTVLAVVIGLIAGGIAFAAVYFMARD